MRTLHWLDEFDPEDGSTCVAVEDNDVDATAICDAEVPYYLLA